MNLKEEVYIAILRTKDNTFSYVNLVDAVELIERNKAYFASAINKTRISSLEFLYKICILYDQVDRLQIFVYLVKHNIFSREYIYRNEDIMYNMLLK